MKIALVHEFLTQFGGAERVLQNFLEIWPEAEVHVLVHNPSKVRHAFDGYKVTTSWINKLPGAMTDHKWYLALMPLGMRSFDLSGYDLVLSDSSSFAKGVTPGPFVHVCYCHTPTRFLWTETGVYLQSTRYPFFVKWLARPVLSWLRRWDYQAAQRPDFYIANSHNVQNRIRQYYGRESVVVPPPVDANFFTPQGERRDYYLAASRLEPYKKIDLVIKTFNKLGWPLKVAGTGSNLPALKKLAGPNIEFVGRVDDAELRQLYSECRAYVFAAEEDAGIMVLEAQACGAPVVAYGAGGSLETIRPGVTGEFFTPQTDAALEQVLRQFDHTKYNSQQIREHALQFDKNIFQQKIKQLVEEQFAARKQPIGKGINS